MNWNEELPKLGFAILESTTKTYGYYVNEKCMFTGSIVYENSKGNIVDEVGKDVKEIFCPFIHADDPRKPNTKYQTIRLKNLQDLNEFIVNKNGIIIAPM